jgi:hypothetical protein
LATSNKNFKVKNGLDVSGTATASSFVKTGGTSADFLMADGSVSAGGGGGSSLEVSETPPASPSLGDIWYNSSSGKTFVYYDSYWVENISGVAGPTGPSSVSTTTVRTNLVANPGFEIDTTHWSSTISSINRVSTTPQSGSWCVGSNYDSEYGGSNVTYQKTNSLIIGQSYRAGVYVRVASGTSTVNLNVGWGETFSQTIITATTSWQLLQSLPIVATTTTANFSVEGLGDNTTFVDSAIIELSSTYTGFFDGSTTDTATVDYAWTGSANASTSTATTTNTVTFAQIAGAIPAGGATGQVLAKTSGTDYATNWTSRLSANDVARINGWEDNTIEPRTRGLGSATVNISSGQMLVTAFTPAANIDVSQITMASSILASGVTFARMGLYELSGDGLNTGTLLARTANDTTLFTAAGTLYTRSFDTTGGYPASLTLVAGTRYGIAHVMLASTMGSRVTYLTVQSGIASTTPYLGTSLNSQTDLPTTATFSLRTVQQLWGKLS